MRLNNAVSYSSYRNVRAGVDLPTSDIAIFFSRSDITINVGGLAHAYSLVLNDVMDVATVGRDLAARSLLLFAVLMLFLHFEVDGGPQSSLVFRSHTTPSWILDGRKPERREGMNWCQEGKGTKDSETYGRAGHTVLSRTRSHGDRLTAGIVLWEPARSYIISTRLFASSS